MYSILLNHPSTNSYARVYQDFRLDFMRKNYPIKENESGQQNEWNENNHKNEQ